MKFWRKYWYYIGGILFVGLAFVMGLWGYLHISTIQIILIFGWMGMLMHQFEEYALPGGFPMVSNMAGLGEVDHPERYPLNARQCFISNVIFCYLSYIIPIFFPNLIWMGASQVFAGVWQVPGHGIAMNIRMKSKYNPGLASSVFLQTPVAIYYIWYVAHYMPDKANQMWWGIPGSIAMLLLTFIIPIIVMRDKDSPYAFEERELFGYNKEHIMELWEERKAEKEAKEHGETIG
ncbi:MAG: HXXEE domain-containing protein [Lachnospiraceae bacterium]|nr:HXXEE domain-containing protein [Lachnospiraceae bacterium]